MKQYKIYKDSGVEWIGEIPKQWEVSKVKFLFDIQKGKTPKKLLNELCESDLEVYLSMDYLRGNPKQIFYVLNDDNIIISEEGDILLLWDGSNAGEFILSKKGVLSSTMAKISNKSINKSYQWFLFKCFERILKDSCNGMGIPHVDGKLFRGSTMPLPPPEEQTQIANYLNHKTVQLDTLITKKEQLISLLQEERTAMINQAVTKGLDPNVSMKDSGIEWLGEIPEHWELSKLKYLIKTTKGFAFKSEMFQDEGVPVVKASDIKKKSVRIKTTHYISKDIYDEFESVKLGVNDILISTVGSTPDVINSAVGQIGKVPLELDGAVLNQNTVRLGISDVLKINNSFLFYLIQNDNYRSYLNLYAHGTANQASLKLVDILGFDIALPSLDEQLKIIKFIEFEEKRINSILSKIQKEIKYLKEYKTSLISDVVTGKVDVREEVLN